MTVEAEVIATLKALPGFSPNIVYLGAAPQPSGKNPAPMPVVIVNRVTSSWPVNFCGTDDQLSLVELQVDYYGLTSESTRRMADSGRAALRMHNLSSEQTLYDDISRGWRVIQSWAVADYAPAV